MTSRMRPLLAATAVGVCPALAAAGPFRPLPDAATPAPAASEDGRGGLPYARGRHFDTLDAYLAFRREQGAIDLPWYKEVAPGLYELQTSVRPAPPSVRITREELERKFGFRR